MSAADACAVDPKYANTGVTHYAWDDFATSFVSLIANHASQDRISEIGDFLFGESVFSDGAYDLLLSQPSFIIIFWIGVIISVLSVAGAVAMLFPCARNWNTKKISSKTMAITGTALAVVSFAFIVTGIVLYSISHFESGYQSDKQPMDAVKKNIDLFTTTAKTQNECFAQSAFDKIYHQNSEVPNSAALNFIEKTGVQKMVSVNYTILSNKLKYSTANQEAVEGILAALQAAKVTITDADALAEVNALIDTYTSIQLDFTKANPITDQITAYGKDVACFEKQMDDLILRTGETSAVPSAERYIVDSYANVNETLDSAAGAFDNAGAPLVHAASQLGFALDGASEVVNSTWIYYRWFLFAPLIFALISSMISIGFGFFFTCAKSHTPIKGVGCGLLVLGVVVLALTSFVLVPAIVGMTFGYASQVSFDPYFYDYNLKGLQISTGILPNLTVKAMNGKYTVPTPFPDLMITCKKETIPFFDAVVDKDGDVIDVTAFGKELDANLDDISSEFATALNTELGKVTFDTTLNPDLQETVHEFLANVNETPDMPNALKADGKEIQAILDQIADWQTTLSPEVGQWLDAYDYSTDNGIHGEYSLKNLTNLDSVKTIIGYEMDDVLADLSKSMQGMGQPLHDDLYKNGESCNRLYQSYADAGDLATVSMAGQVQGMWAAAGLVSLFFIPLAISLLCIGNAFRHGEEKHFAVAAAPPAAVHPTPAKAPAVAHPPAPLVVPNAVVAVPAPAPRRAEPLPPAVPIRSTSYQPRPQSPPPPQQQWQPVYLPPQPVSTFVDPLAYPKTAAAAHPVQGSYAGGPANGYYGQPTSRH